MPFINFNTNKVIKIWDGIYGTLSHSEKQTFGHLTIDAGTILPAHSHFHEQWCHVLEGELEFDIEGEKMNLTKGMTAYIPSNAVHSAVAHTQCKVIDCFTPAREDFIALEKQASSF